MRGASEVYGINGITNLRDNSEKKAVLSMVL